MRLEFSAGGVVIKRDPSASSGQSKIFVLLAQHAKHHGWVFPKGLIGDHIEGEQKEDTAVREVKEETGADAVIVQALKPVTFWYQFQEEKIKKTVYYYLMDYTGGDITKHDHEMENVEWLKVDEVEERLTYNSDKDVWQEAQGLLK